MSDPRLAKLADVLVNYSTAIQPGEWTVIMGNVPGLALVRQVYRCVLEAGGHPQVVLGDEQLTALKVGLGSDDQLDWVSPLSELMYARMDAWITFRAEENTQYMSGGDPARLARLQKSHGHLMDTYFQRAAKGDLRWVVTRFPTQASAQQAEMSLEAYEGFVFAACKADQADPIAAWRQVEKSQMRVVDWLQGKRHVEVRGPDCELSLSIEARPFVSSHGLENIPDGEIFTGPVEDSVDGWIRFSYPAVYSGREVKGVELRFEAGKVVEARAEKNESFLLSQLDVDEGARYLGEFAIGTNEAIQRYTGDPLFDEKIGGTIHVALGAGYPETGSENKSAIHWDLVCDMKQGGEIRVDGELIYQSGEFLID